LYSIIKNLFRFSGLTVFRGHGAHGLVVVRMRVVRMLRTDALVRMRCDVVFRGIELARILDVQLARRQWGNAIRSVAQTVAHLTAGTATAAGKAAHAAGGGATTSTSPSTAVGRNTTP